jgi:putative holliday junction resolvase
MARLLGIDFGEKRVGVSLSDEGARLAFPHITLSNNKDLLKEILSLVEEYQVEKVVIGDSKDFNMKENRIMQDAHDFAENLSEKIEVVFHQEFMTSMQAEKNTFSIIRETQRPWCAKR